MNSNFLNWLKTNGVDTFPEKDNWSELGVALFGLKRFFGVGRYRKLKAFYKKSIYELHKYKYNPDMRKLCSILFDCEDVLLLNIMRDLVTKSYAREINFNNTSPHVYKLHLFSNCCWAIRVILKQHGKDSVKWALRHRFDDFNNLFINGDGVIFSVIRRYIKIPFKILLDYGSIVRQSENDQIARETKLIFSDTVAMFYNTKYLTAFEEAKKIDCPKSREYIQYYKKLKQLSLNLSTIKKQHDQAIRYIAVLQKHLRYLLKGANQKFPDPPKYFKETNMFSYIKTSLDLEDEGAIMRHCVGGYSDKCLSGKCFIFRYENKGVKGTIEIENNKVRQFRGFLNKAMPPECWDDLKKWAGPRLAQNAEHNIVQ